MAELPSIELTISFKEPETRPTTLRNLQAEENKNLREQVAAGKDRMTELRAKIDRLTSAPVSQLRADLETQIETNKQLSGALNESREACHAEAKLRQSIANELASVREQLRGMTAAPDRLMQTSLDAVEIRSLLLAIRNSFLWPYRDAQSESSLRIRIDDVLERLP